ncbi:Uncharacterised protein [Edwardsiella ictaluri]|nr:Uncharacterised protein [Edwardsiella ictaluri]
MRFVFYLSYTMASVDCLRFLEIIARQRPAQRTIGLVNGVFQRLARTETRNLRGRNINFLARLRITASAGSTFADVKSTKTDQCNGVTFLHAFGHGCNECIQRTTSCRFGNICTLSNFVDQL